MIAKLKQGFPGMTVSGPNTVDSLVLKATDGKSYQLPTASFTYSDPKSGSAAAIYSVSELSNKSHAVVASICGNATTDTTALMTRANDLRPIASTIQVKLP